MELKCPKCHASMRTYERNDVHVDQCTECRGIFLDRGELERLVAAENAWHGADSGPRHQESSGGHGSLGGVVGEVLQRGQKHSSSGQQYGQQYGHKRRKKSFLDELFD